MVFRIVGATKSYKNRTLFEDFQLEMAAGDIKAVIGENGSGKTSLFRGIIGEIPMDYSERIIPDASQWSFVCPSPIGFFRNLTVLENLKSFSEDNDCNESLRFLEHMRLEYILNKAQYQLSMGQNSILHMSRAFLKPDLKLLVADELTAHLDQQKQKLLFEFLNHKAASGMAILVSAQNQDQISDLTEDVISIEGAN